MNTFQYLTILIALAGIAVQQYERLKRLKADHERQKKQSTIEDFGDAYLLCRYEIEAKYGLEPITAEASSKIDNDLEKCAAINKLLGTLEHVAVGVNVGVYDRDVVFRMSAGSMIRIRHQLHHYIEHRRRVLSQPKLFNEYEKLTRDFEAIYQPQPSNQGDIKHSKTQ
jgi:Domain of unknown function (DUF4760)